MMARLNAVRGTETRQDGYTEQQARVACEFQSSVERLPSPDYSALKRTLLALREQRVACTLEACWSVYHASRG